MNQQELNKKLAEWAGLEHKISDIGTDEWWYGAKRWRIFPPNFAQSLDACIEWLVPKAISEICENLHCRESQAYRLLFERWYDQLMLNAEASSSATFMVYPALALCLAIEKLVNNRQELRSNVMNSALESNLAKLKNLGSLLSSVAGSLLAAGRELENVSTRVAACENSLESIQKELMKVIASMRNEEE